MYTGEMMDANALVYLRARYYHPGLGVFTSLDPVEGVNRYQYVGGNVVNAVDPSGMIGESPGQWDPCSQIFDQCEITCNYEAALYARFRVPSNYVLCVHKCRERSDLEERRRLLRSYIDNLYGCLSAQFPGNYPAEGGMECNLPESEYPSGSVDAMVKIMTYAERLFLEGSSKNLVGEISSLFFGTSGPFTVFNLYFSPDAGDWHPLAMRGNVGLHSDYYQPAGQVRHFWAYLDTVAQGGELVATQADIYHECLEDRGTVEDARLSSVAFGLGKAVREGLSSSELAQRISERLGENGTGFGGFFAEHYYTDPTCKSKLRQWGYTPSLPYPPGVGSRRP